ncbi:MAG: tRNA (mnm(5)s(2)U34)-methyltransferase [Chlamydiia bacterium]
MIPLLQVHELTKIFSRQVVQPFDLLIDATVGNGHDTLFLMNLAEERQCRVIGFDIQTEALEAAKLRLKNSSIRLIHASHAEFDAYPEINHVGLILYNLGYLPGKDKNITTLGHSTLESIQKGLDRLRPLGGIGITCYSGHPEGQKEIALLEDLAASLDAKKYVSTWTHWTNRLHCPSVLLIQKMGP